MDLKFTFFYFVVFVVVIIALKLLTTLFKKHGWTDHSNERKNHNGSVPFSGGLSMFIGFLVGLWLITFEAKEIEVLLLVSLIAIIIGLVDDIFDNSPYIRLLFQFGLVLIIISNTAVRIETFGDIFNFEDIYLQNFSTVVTLLAIITAMNAVNMMDGKDGLASGISLVAFSSVLYMASVASMQGFINLSLLYIVVIIPFIIYNFSKNKVFMGDSGSLFLGLGIVLMLIRSSQGEFAIMRPVTVLWIFSLPLIDIVSVVLLRLIKGASPFLPDTNHMHHHLGYMFQISDKKVTLMLVTFSSLMAALGIVADKNNVSEWIMFLGFIVIFFSYLLFIFFKLKKKCNPPIFNNR